MQELKQIGLQSEETKLGLNILSPLEETWFDINEDPVFIVDR